MGLPLRLFLGLETRCITLRRRTLAERDAAIPDTPYDEWCAQVDELLKDLETQE